MIMIMMKKNNENQINNNKRSKAMKNEIMKYRRKYQAKI